MRVWIVQYAASCGSVAFGRLDADESNFRARSEALLGEGDGASREIWVERAGTLPDSTTCHPTDDLVVEVYCETFGWHEACDADVLHMLYDWHEDASHGALVCT